MALTNEVDLMLSDRLRELGMDFVADVVEGKARPSEVQASLLSRGVTPVNYWWWRNRRRLRQENGLAVIGGAADGRKIREGERYCLLPSAPPSPEMTECAWDQYRLERLMIRGPGGHVSEHRFYVFEGMPLNEALERVFRHYNPEPE